MAAPCIQVCPPTPTQPSSSTLSQFESSMRRRMSAPFLAPPRRAHEPSTPSTSSTTVKLIGAEGRRRSSVVAELSAALGVPLSVGDTRKWTPKRHAGPRLLLCLCLGYLLLRITTRVHKPVPLQVDVVPTHLPVSDMSPRQVKLWRPRDVWAAAASASRLGTQKQVILPRDPNAQREREENLWAPTKTTSSHVKYFDPADGHHGGTVILLADRGDDGETRRVPGALAIRWPGIRWVTVSPPKEYEDVPARWYDDENDKEDERGIHESSKLINEIVRMEQQLLVDSLRNHSLITRHLKSTDARRESEKTTASERIVVAGFGQGAAMALFAGSTTEKALGGVVSLGTAPLLLKGQLQKLVTDLNRRQLPIYMGHGLQDERFSVNEGRNVYTYLTSIDAGGLGFTNVEYKDYDEVRHELHASELDDVSRWLSQRVYRGSVAQRLISGNKYIKRRSKRV